MSFIKLVSTGSIGTPITEHPALRELLTQQGISCTKGTQRCPHPSNTAVARVLHKQSQRAQMKPIVCTHPSFTKWRAPLPQAQLHRLAQAVLHEACAQHPAVPGARSWPAP